MAFGACISGFQACCRLTISIDETHLKRKYKGIVDASFCPGYSFHFNVCGALGPFCVKSSSLGLEPILLFYFIYFIESLSRFVLVIYFVFISYLIVICCVVLYRAMSFRINLRFMLIVIS